jgi:hypothetical protein
VSKAADEDDDDALPVNGINFSLDFTSEHTSSIGWSNALTPTLSYRFNSHFSVEGDVPWYLSIKDYVQTTSQGVATDTLAETNNVIGDTEVSGMFEASHEDFDYSLTASGSFPTGNSEFELSAGRSAYNVTTDFDYSIGPFTPAIEIGEGNSSALTNYSVKKPYTAVGPQANFEAGSSVDLPRNLSLDFDAYEDMPIGNQKVYGTAPSQNGSAVIQQTVQGAGTAEDNGFDTELEIPLGTHLTLAGNYERSLIQRTDTLDLSVTWVLRAPKEKAAHVHRLPGVVR